MTEYHQLNENGLQEIRRQKVLQLEIEHARIDLDLRLARATGLQTEEMAVAEGHMRIIEEQIAMLLSWMKPVPELASNGHRPES